MLRHSKQMAAPLIFRPVPLLRHNLHRNKLSVTASSLARRPCPNSAPATESPKPEYKKLSSSEVQNQNTNNVLPSKDKSKFNRWIGDPDYRKWKAKEEEILGDVEPIIVRTKFILHSDRYMDGERLTEEDEKAVREKLLSYHPHCDNKVGSGLSHIMVDRHPQFKQTRCLFVVRKDGVWIDFSYQKCLKTYIRLKFPSYAKRFIREHYKR